MKKVLSDLLVLSVFLTGCTFSNSTNSSSASDESATIITADTSLVETTGVTQSSNASSNDYIDEQAKGKNFRSLSDPELLEFMEGAIYAHLIEKMGDDVCIDNVSAIYISQEFIDELTYNSKSNVFFGYTLKELDEQFQGQSYIFTVENGQSVVKPRAPYDDTYDKMIRNIAIGTGVILVCVTISIVTYGAGAAAASAIFACAAKSGAIMGLSSGAISGVATGLTTGIKTGDWEQAKKEGALAGSESFKFGAICGAITGGASEAIGLKMVTLSEGSKLSMNDVAIIQRESKLPLNVISKIKDMDQYKILREAGLYGEMVNGKMALIRKIDLDFEYEGKTNLARMLEGNAPIDPQSKLPYELHHLAQEENGRATLAILTKAEHTGKGNNSILHDATKNSVIDRDEFREIRKAFWQALGEMLQKTI